MQEDKGTTYPFELPPLPYAFDALEPVIDAKTMELHHDKHHATYIKNLNNALKGHPEFEGKTIEQILTRLDAVPEAIRQTIRNNGGGHANHQLFWKLLKPGGVKQAGGEFARALFRDFGSIDAFKTAFQDAGAKHFGSGWVFLVVNPKAGNKLEVITKPNQDSVLGDGLPAVCGNDVWEHAYYLKYQSRRPDYLKAWWDVLNWTVCGERYDTILAGHQEKLGGPAK